MFSMIPKLMTLSYTVLSKNSKKNTIIFEKTVDNNIGVCNNNYYRTYVIERQF